VQQANKNQETSMTLGDKINALYELRDKKRDLQAELKILDEAFRELELSILNEMDAQGTTLTRGSRATVSISESIVPTVTDWDQFYDYVRENDAMYLFERRVAATAWRELLESGDKVPGTEPFTKRSLSLRKL
jgi:hypothetical protein